MFLFLFYLLFLHQSNPFKVEYTAGHFVTACPRVVPMRYSSDRSNRVSNSKHKKYRKNDKHIYFMTTRKEKKTMEVDRKSYVSYGKVSLKKANNSERFQGRIKVSLRVLCSINDPLSYVFHLKTG